MGNLTSRSPVQGPCLPSLENAKHKAGAARTDVVVKPDELADEFCMHQPGASLLSSIVLRTLAAVHDDPYLRANALVNEFC